MKQNGYFIVLMLKSGQGINISNIDKDVALVKRGVAGFKNTSNAIGHSHHIAA